MLCSDDVYYDTSTSFLTFVSVDDLRITENSAERTFLLCCLSGLFCCCCCRHRRLFVCLFVCLLLFFHVTCVVGAERGGGTGEFIFASAKRDLFLSLFVARSRLVLAPHFLSF